MSLTTSERQHGKPAVPVELQRRRILFSLSTGTRPAPMSAMAYIAFPDFTFRSKQGAALCISRTVRALCDDGMLTGRDHGYLITNKGREWVQAVKDKDDE